MSFFCCTLCFKAQLSRLCCGWTSFLWVTPDDWLSLCERCRSCGKAWPLLGNASSLFNPTTIHPDAGFANAIHALQGRKATAIVLFQRLERQVGTIDNGQRSNEKAVFSFQGLRFRVQDDTKWGWMRRCAAVMANNATSKLARQSGTSLWNEKNEIANSE